MESERASVELDLAERDLVERVCAGDRAAFRELIGRYERLVRHVVGRLLDDPADAEEVFQDVFLRVYRGLPGFRSDAKLSTWIGRIAFNTAARRLRREKGAPWVDAEQADSVVNRGAVRFEVAATLQPVQLDAVVARELREHVRAQVARLPRAQRLAVTLYHGDGLPIAEVAEIMGVPENTVKSHLFRGRRSLKEMLKGRLGDE